MSRSVCVMVRQPPRRGRKALETFELALAMVTYDHDLRVIFAGDGVWQLIDGQRSDQDERLFTQGWESLRELGLARLIADADDLERRSLSQADLRVPVEFLDASEIDALVGSSEVVL